MLAQDIDTLPCGQRVREYYYPHWFDTSDLYLHPDNFYFVYDYTWHFMPRSFGEICPTEAYQQYTDKPIRIRGLWAMVSQYASNTNYLLPWIIIQDSTRLPEYLYLYARNPKVEMDTVTWDTNRWLIPVAHARWDTNQPKMLCMQKFADGRFGNAYCHLYEAIFDSVITVQGEYWIGGTANSNLMPNGEHVSPYFPTIYLQWGRRDGGRDDPYAYFTHTPFHGDPEGPFYPPTSKSESYGPFGVITDGQHFVQLSSADTAQGAALYSAFYPDSSYQTITAVPAHGYLFSHWNDSVTDNPRTVFVTQDTAFTAFFRPAPLHTVTVRPNDDALGYTTGDSTYYENDPAVIKAVPLADSIRFLHWNDSVTDNPRTIVVMQDTAFTAYFEPIQHEGIAAPDGRRPLFTLTPNPAHNSVTVTINSQLSILNSQFSIALTDAAGRELLTLKVQQPKTTIPLGQYPAGTYFVTLRTPDATSTQRLVIE